MKLPNQAFVAIVLTALLASTAFGQDSATVPPQVRFSGKLSDAAGQPLTGTLGITFLLYKDEQGGNPLWTEMQSVTPDKNGHYAVTLGSTSAQGLPADLFVSGEARWLALQPEGQAERPRILLLSVPYAMKAADAQTLGGLPASAFMLANEAKGTTASIGTTPSNTTAAAKSSAPPPANPAVTGKGTVDFIPMWDTASDIVSSVLFQKSSQIGIGTTSPAAALDVNGKSDLRDTLTLFPKGTDSTLAISGTLFKIDQTGKIAFISGQTFPGAGTITGITTASGSGLKGGGTKGTLSLGILSAGVTNTMLQHSSFTLNANTAGGLTAPGAMTLGSTYMIGLKPCATSQILQYSGSTWNCASAGTGTITGVTAGTDLTGGGATGAVTLNLDTTKVPLLASSNTFTNEQVINTGGLAPGLSVTSGGGIYSVGSGVGITGVTVLGGLLAAGVVGQDQSNNQNSSGVYGFSSAGSGVFGGSSTGYGVVGGGGIAGISGSSTSGKGVYGNVTGTGIAVHGYMGGTAGQGVWGETQGTSFLNGAGSDGVHGVAHSTAGSGVAGVNDAQDATGVYGSDQQGYGFVTDSHVQQGRSMGGWVKAMVFVQPAGGGIVRCFNSQLNGSVASTPPCGMTFTHYLTGSYVLDFGFQVNDRFFTVTGFGPSDAIFGTVLPGGTQNQLDVTMYDPIDDNYEDPAGFSMIIF